MPDPKEVFNNPRKFWDLITSSTDDVFEGQCFDRKEAGKLGIENQLPQKALKKIKNQFVECISAFENSNCEGGLLVVGVSKNGEVMGVSHLSETQMNSITAFNDLLRNQSSITRIIDCKNSENCPDKILLIYTPYAENGICETLKQPPKAWVRNGKQNIPVNDQMRDQLKRDKRIVEFERSYCCPFEKSDIDIHVLNEFKKVFLSDASFDLSDEEILYEAGIIQRDGSGYAWNNAGFLFLSKNPRRMLPWAHIRLLRFPVSYKDDSLRESTTLDKSFDGPVAQQIRKIRSFFRESGFFKTYQIRNPKGGFIDDPEFPFIAIDEAIVNAVAHRDYGVELPIECTHYHDAFVVRNPGRIIQRDQDLPPSFTLDTTTLNSMPRNSKLIEWLKMMRDENGSAFVRAISEGTKRMGKEMAEANLPSPLYNITHISTKVTLFNNVLERESILKSKSKSLSTDEFANLFLVDFLMENGKKANVHDLKDRRAEIMNYFCDALEAYGWYIDKKKFGRVTAHRRGSALPLPRSVSKFIGFYPAYSFQLREYHKKLYFAVDYTLTVRNISNAQKILNQIDKAELIGKLAVGQYKGWQKGKIKEIDNEYTNLYVFSYDSEVKLPNDKVIPDMYISNIKQILKNKRISFDISREIKKHSLSIEPKASRIRNDKILATVEHISESMFPLKCGELIASLNTAPENLYRNDTKDGLVVKSLTEPSVEFNHHKETPDIRNGITKFGAYEDCRKTIELVPICNNNLRKQMSALIERLKAGKFKYSGSEKTFGTKLTYNSIITVNSEVDVLQECNRLLEDHPDWIEEHSLNRIFIVHTPEAGYSLDDENSPYYQVKRLLLENGIPCQMIDTPTILNPDWKDLNLSLNIISKCGVTPWVLPNKIPDADFFIGLSYTQSRKRGSKKLLGYATVFNEFGRWEFYTGNTNVFSYEERTKYFSELTVKTLKRLTLSETPSIYFHYSARFSIDDRKAILKAARSVRPNGAYSFVWINPHHTIRLFDKRPQTDGSLSRGCYVITAPNQILLSTTGYNPFKKTLGTPKPLEITIRSENPDGSVVKEPDLKSLAVQILSLTKLNWASTDSLSGEPITTKYAGDIAYLTDAFLRQADQFKLSRILERTPWFI